MKLLRPTLSVRGKLLSKDPVLTATITKINWLMLFKEITAVNCENHTEVINMLCGQNAGL
jgi:hypothetical protein